jgi:hypothetical protein
VTLWKLRCACRDESFDAIIGNGYGDAWIDINQYFASKYPERYTEAPSRMEVITNKARSCRRASCGAGSTGLRRRSASSCPGSRTCPQREPDALEPIASVPQVQRHPWAEQQGPLRHSQAMTLSGVPHRTLVRFLALPMLPLFLNYTSVHNQKYN